MDGRNENIRVKLERMAKRGTLEVEHLLRAARTPSPELADALDRLADQMDWSPNGSFPTVPFGTWVQILGVFCRQGYGGLVSAASDADMQNFVSGVLEELKTVEAARAAIAIATGNRDVLLADQELMLGIAGTLNQTAANVSADSLTSSELDSGRAFLHEALNRANGDNVRGTILCALRYFGDETTLPLIADCPELPDEWEPARTGSIRAIKKRARLQKAISQ